MSALRSSALPWLAPLLLLSPVAPAQNTPHLAYAYPAGVRQGAAVAVSVGGQYLGGVTDAHISGDGVQVEVVKYVRPLSQKELNDLRQKLRELERRAREAGRGGRRRSVPPEADAIQAIARELDLDLTGIDSIAELRKKFFDPKKQLNPQLAETVILRLRTAPDATPGERELRLGTRSGVSNPIGFHIGEWPEFQEVEPNDRSTDLEIPRLPAILNGRILPGDVDRFRFRAAKTESLVVAVSARELVPYLADAVPGWFQATLALYDEAGREVAYADDYRFHPDPVVCYAVPEDGTYTLEIKDAIYRGREDFIYRVAVGEMPFVTSIFPLGGRAGRRTDIEVTGWNLPLKTLTVNPEREAAGIRSVSFRRGRRILNHVPFAVDTLPECREAEPNDEIASAQRIRLPRIVNGRIERPGDLDAFVFKGRKGEEIVAEVNARRLNSPLDSLLRLTDAHGRLLAANDDHEDRTAGLVTHHADSFLHVTLPAAGEYHLRLSDVQKNGGRAFGYRLRVSRPRPDFELRVVPSAIGARAGTIVPITVHAVRRDGFDGGILLELDDAPRGFSLSGGWVPADQDRIRVTMTIPPMRTAEPLELHLRGRATIGGRVVRKLAVPAEDRMQAFIYRHLVPSEEWTVTVSGGARTPFAVQVLGEKPVKLFAGGTTAVRVSAHIPQPAGEVRLELQDPPRGIRIERVAMDTRGLAIFIHAESGEAEPGLKGNLILNAFTEREAGPGSGGGGRRRVARGTLPAIPFEVVRVGRF